MLNDHPTFVRIPEGYSDDVPPGLYRVVDREWRGEELDYSVVSIEGGAGEYVVDGWKVIHVEAVDSAHFRSAHGSSQRAYKLLRNLRLIYEAHPDRLKQFIEQDVYPLLEEMEAEQSEGGGTSTSKTSD